MSSKRSVRPSRAPAQGVRLDPQPDTATLPVEESRLVRAAQKGDVAAFSRLVDTYWNGLHRWLYHLSRDRHTAEDLTQETFLRAFRGLGSFQPGTNFRGWLFRIGHNLFVNQCRASRHAARQPVPDDLPARDEDPLEKAAGHETAHRIAGAVARLPEEFRAALLLRAEQGLSFRDIGAILDVTEETARWRVFKARQKVMTEVLPAPDREKP